MVIVPPDPKDPVEEYWTEQDPERATLRVEIQPGKTAKSHFETKYASEVSAVVLLEARGREQSTLERLRSKLF